MLQHDDSFGARRCGRRRAVARSFQQDSGALVKFTTAMALSQLFAIFGLLITGVAAGDCSPWNHNCATCVTQSDTNGWVTTSCGYCPSTGQCSGSMYDSCSSSSWTYSSSSCRSPPPPPPATHSWISGTGNRYCNGGYYNYCDPCNGPSTVGSSHPGAVWCSVRSDSCCSQCPRGQTTADSGSQAGRCVSIGSPGTSWYRGGH
jgi:hypothetical protein